MPRDYTSEDLLGLWTQFVQLVGEAARRKERQPNRRHLEEMSEFREAITEALLDRPSSELLVERWLALGEEDETISDLLASELAGVVEIGKRALQREVDEPQHGKLKLKEFLGAAGTFLESLQYLLENAGLGGLVVLGPVELFREMTEVYKGN